jgi:hypothetical protein
LLAAVLGVLVMQEVMVAVVVLAVTVLPQGLLVAAQVLKRL